MPFLIPLVVSLLSVSYSIYASQKYFFRHINNIKIAALSNKLQRAAFAYLFRLYKVVAIIGFLILVLIFSVPQLSSYTALGFIVGLLSAAFVGYFALLFLIKLNAHTADNSYRGLIESFRSVLMGSSVISTFVLGFSLFVISIYLILLSPAAEDLVAMSLGAVIVMVLSRIGANSYAQSILKDSKIIKNISEQGSSARALSVDRQKENRDPEVVAFLVGHNIEDGLSLSTTIYGVFTVSIVASVLIGSSTLGSAVALPLLIGAVGIISSFVGVKLVRVGATTNIFKNVSLSVLSTILIASIILFPVLAWALSVSLQYSNILIWLVAILGFFGSGLIFLLYCFVCWRNIRHVQAIVLSVLLGTSLLYISNAIGGLYAISIFVISLASMAASIMSLLIFSSIAHNTHHFSKITELPEESIKQINKLNYASRIFRTGVNMYLWLLFLLVSLIIFFLYKQEITSKATHLDFALDNPVLLAGIFLGGVFIYWVLYFVSRSPQKIRIKIINSISKQLAEIRGKSGRVIKPDHHALVDTIADFTLREMVVLFLIIFSVPILVGSIFKAEALGGFLVGAIVLGGFLAIQIILDREEINSKNTKREKLNVFVNRLVADDKIEDISSNYSYALIIMTTILSLSITSLFLVAFLI